jgi:hypothetical protein
MLVAFALDGMSKYADIAYEDLVALQHCIRQRVEVACRLVSVRSTLCPFDR